MSGTNHIVGGTVFTGIFASFMNVNIFEKPHYIFFTAFFSILADVDHLKSPIGKLFYPVAKFLDRNFGHRTITHSVFFFTFLVIFVLLLEQAITGGKQVTFICAVSYFSHLLFDMLTKQGIPLLYPFKRNPCVIPANPELRLKSSDIKTESVIFAIFCILGLTCQSLFANGFWNTYNQNFNDLKHLNQEFNLTENLLLVDFEFKNEFGKKSKGKGYLVKSKETEAIILSEKEFITIKSSDKITLLKPHRTTKKQATNEQIFISISLDSLTKITRNKPVLSLNYQSSESSIQKKFDYIYNPILSEKTDDSTKIKLYQRLEILEEELRQEKQKVYNVSKTRTEINQRIIYINNAISHADFYTREKLTNELNQLKKIEFTDEQNNINKINIQIQHIHEQILLGRQIKYSGILVTLAIK